MTSSVGPVRGAASGPAITGLHVLFLLLLAIATVRTVLLSDRDGVVVALSVAMLGTYLAGIPLGRAARRAPDASRAPAYGWLAALGVLWTMLVLLSAEYSWVAFALFFLALHLLPSPLRYVVVVGLALIVVGTQLGSAAAMNPGQVIGPLLGALVAVGSVVAFERVVAESEERRRLLAELIAAQDDLLVVNDELVATQRAAGALAERARLARDIHDTLAQGFSSIVLLSRVGLGADITPGSASSHDLLQQIEATASENLAEARRVVHALTPADLEEAPLPAALGRLLGRFRAQTGVPAELRIDGPPRQLPTPHEVALLRLAQGALANVREHASAHRVGVTLTYLPDATALDVVDDGRGFDPAALNAPAAGTGFGLRAMRERLADVGGTLSVESERGDGTAVCALIPAAAREVTSA